MARDRTNAGLEARANESDAMLAEALPVLFTVAEAAERLSVSRSLLYAIIEAGGLAVYRLGQGRGTIRIAQADLQRFLTDRYNSGQPVCKPSEVPRRPSLRHLKL